MLASVSLDHLRMFIAAADEGSFSAGGRRLRRAQSVISQTLANLEAQLGVKLFDRSSRSPVLTGQGLALLAEARAVVSRMDAFKARAKGLSGGLEPELSVVVDVMFPLEALTTAVAAFQAELPATPLTLYVEAPGAVLQPVMDGRCAFGVMGSLPPPLHTSHLSACSAWDGRSSRLHRIPWRHSGPDSTACPCATQATRFHRPFRTVARKRLRRFFSEHLAARRPWREARLLTRRSGLGRHAGGRDRNRSGKWIVG
jgi:DNA-binding transcriptional LysR family regulator